MLEDHGHRARLEIALLVEDAVVGQELLGVLGDDATVADHAGEVEAPPHLAARVSQHQGQPRGIAGRLAGDARQLGLHPGVELGAQQEVLGRIAGQRKLGEHHQIDTLGVGGPGGGDHPIRVARDVSDQ